MLSLKPGITIGKLKPQMVLACNIAAWCFIEESYHTTVTSGDDGKHGIGSLHYDGEAIDLRINHIPSSDTVARIVEKLKTNLGNNYDVVLESDHIHIEFDPN